MHPVVSILAVAPPLDACTNHMVYCSQITPAENVFCFTNLFLIFGQVVTLVGLLLYSLVVSERLETGSQDMDLGSIPLEKFE